MDKKKPAEVVSKIPKVRRDLQRGASLMVTQSEKALLQKRLLEKSGSTDEQPTEEGSTLEQAAPPVNASSSKVRVVCRFRPFNARELREANDRACASFVDQHTVAVAGTNPETGQYGQQKYNFDRVFPPTTH